MELIDFRRPSAGFGNPLHVWLACHDRLERVVALTARLLEYVDVRGADEAAGITAREIRRYFDEALPRHHADEDESLFPRVLARARAAKLRGAGDGAGAIERLVGEHAELDAEWPGVRDMLCGVEAGSAGSLDRTLIGRFGAAQIEHHKAEDRIVCPLAQRLLSPSDLHEVGAAMAARRGLAWRDLEGAA